MKFFEARYLVQLRLFAKYKVCFSYYWKIYLSNLLLNGSSNWQNTQYYDFIVVPTGLALTLERMCEIFNGSCELLV